MRASLRHLLTHQIPASVSPAIWARGTAYSYDRRVEHVIETEDRIEATVRGSSPYRVALWGDGPGPGWSCTCPYAEDGTICKHVVAVLMTVEVDRPAGEPPESERSPHELADYVRGLDHGRLVDLVLDQASMDWSLAEALRAEARSAKGESLDTAEWRQRITVVFAPDGGFVPYGAAAEWAGEINEVLDTLDSMIDAGHPEAVIELARFAHRQADRAIHYVDDSDGWLTDISARIAEVHHRACLAARPDPRSLAEQLAELELTSELDGFRRAAFAWSDVLGPVGIDEFRRILETGAGPSDDHDSWKDEYVVSEARRGVALASGDPDELVEVLRPRLRRPDDYIEIADSLDASGREEEAIEWLEAGLQALGDRSWQSSKLRNRLAEVLRGRGEGERSVGVFWDGFVRGPSLETYRRLVAEAESVTSDRDWSDKAIDWLRGRVGEGRSADAQALAGILLYEGRPDEAWQVARDYGCDDDMWLKLARAREDDHPLDAVEVYEREIERQIDTKTSQGYRAAVDLMARVRRLDERAGRPERFFGFIARVRAEHGRKRNLMALFETKGWTQSTAGPDAG